MWCFRILGSHIRHTGLMVATKINQQAKNQSLHKIWNITNKQKLTPWAYRPSTRPDRWPGSRPGHRDHWCLEAGTPSPLPPGCPRWICHQCPGPVHLFWREIILGYHSMQQGQEGWMCGCCCCCCCSALAVVAAAAPPPVAWTGYPGWLMVQGGGQGKG